MLGRTCLFPFALCALLSAQSEVVDFAAATAAVNKLLASAEPADVAWGAHQAQRLGLRDAVPQLRQTLGKWTSKTRDDAVYARHYLLDALIQLGARLPGEELAPQLEGQLEPLALILMARDASSHPALLFAVVQRHWQRGSSDLRLAAGNLLAASKHPGFAVWLMRRLPLRLSVTVRDIDPAMMGVGTGGAGGSSRSLVTKLAATWPPVPRYRLTTTPMPFAVLLAGGEQPVYFERREDDKRIFRLEASSSNIVPPGPSAHRWLMAMARSDARRLGLPLHRFELVRWRDAESYAKQVSAWRTEIEDAFAKLGRRLVIRGAMTEAEMQSLTCEIGLDVKDDRTDRKVPLPEVAARSGR